MVALRNIAIIAHVDHGKTTLVDHMLRQSGAFRSNQVIEDCVMDSNPIEKERGITILAKNTSLTWRDVKINIVDTPGHHDFGGEVERTLRMADGCLLLVDAADGPMPQTRFVLRKALAAGLSPIVVVNKMDRPEARPEEVVEAVFYLFMELGATDAQMDFPVIYAIGREGRAKLKPEDPWSDLRPLFDAILARVPPPAGDPAGSLQIPVCAIDYNDYVGRMAIGPVVRGAVEMGMPAVLLGRDGRRVTGTITGLNTFERLDRQAAKRVEAGEIVCVAGLPEVNIGDTIGSGENPEALPFAAIDEPTLALVFLVNDSPLAGREGMVLTSPRLKERLQREAMKDPALRVEPADQPTAYRVCGRGLLHLGILLENIRREGYELAVSRPEIITKTVDGRLCEPMELATIDVPGEFVSRVLELVGTRRGSLTHMETRPDRTFLTVRIPTRGLIGLPGALLSATRGESVIHSAFDGYADHMGPIEERDAGVLVAQEGGSSATSYALDNLRGRGLFFVVPGTLVYPGMIVGEHCHSNDLVVNIARERKLTNVRARAADVKVVLPRSRTFSLEEAIEYITGDELVEITPKSLRMRKKVLSFVERRRQDRLEASA